MDPFTQSCGAWSCEYFLTARMKSEKNTTDVQRRDSAPRSLHKTAVSRFCGSLTDSRLPLEVEPTEHDRMPASRARSSIGLRPLKDTLYMPEKQELEVVD